MIAMHKLCKAFGDKIVLRNFSCELEEGRVTALMAPSGAGKTTLLVTHEAREAEQMGAKIIGLLDSES